jgi:predicted PurR-regulated permease PerM
MLAVSILVFIQTFAVLSAIYLSFLLTLLISLALNPLVNKLRTLTGGRKGATALVVLFTIAIIALAGWAFYTPLKDSVTNLTEALPRYWERLQKPLIKMEQHAERSEVRLQAEVKTEIAGANEANEQVDSDEKPAISDESLSGKESNTIRSNLGQMLGGVVGSFTKVAFNGAQMLVVLVTVFFGVIFTLMNPRPIIGAFFSLVPERHHPQAVVIMHRICRFAPAWGGSTLAGMLTIGVLVFLLMWPLLGFMDAMVLGAIAGLLEAIPFLGPTLSTVPALLLSIGKGGMTPLWVLLAYIVVQALENNVILPLIMARGMKVHAVAIIFSMLLCVTAFGVLGVLVAAPLVAIVSIIHEELYRKKFLPSVTDTDLDKLARKVLHEKDIELA